MLQSCSCLSRDVQLYSNRNENAPFCVEWVKQFLEHGATGAELMNTECSACRLARVRMKRVISGSMEDMADLDKPPFDTAPAIYAYNVPRYYALLTRARKYAAVNNLQLSWCVARDIPLHREDRELPEDKLHAKRCRWLFRHDQDTCHISSQTPLAYMLPMRLTDAVDRDKSLYRNKRVFLIGWAPHPEEERIDIDGEFLLSHLPPTLYIYSPGATWTVHEDLGVGVYPLPQVSRTWKPSKASKIRIRRTGFFVVPDFACTGHTVQGSSLDASFPNLVNADFTEQITEELQIAGYVMLSRTKFLENQWVMQHFSPGVFTRGPPLAPSILMKKLRGQISEEEAIAELKENSM